MKKRLLISTALMTAVLTCALSTGTYAWYQAIQQVNVASANITLGAANVTALDTVDLDVTFEIEGHDNTKVVLVNNDGEQYAWVNGELVQIEKKSDEVKFYTITITGASIPQDKAESVYAAAKGTYTVTVETTSERFILHSEEPEEKFTTPGEPISFEITLDIDKQVTMDEQTFYVVVNGEDGGTPDSLLTSPVTADLKFTIEKKQ